MNDKKSLKYIEKLHNKSIEIIPLETYKGSETKIKHLCTCGNIWEVTPQNVLKDIKCGCRNNDKVFTNEKYLSLLKENNIDIKPLETYKGMLKKIKHLCTCGNEWETIPQTVLKGYKCGCKKLIKDEEKYANRPTVLYYIKIGDLYKIGVAMMRKQHKTAIEAIKTRYSQDVKMGIKYDIIDYKLYDNGIEALREERKILEEFSEFQYKGEKILIAGNTELFNEKLSICSL